ncbi:MAG: DUF134 domain-containing protein [Deltaproteobacteria bacterium]|nr:DUF134 domain-containing protein [Deltaproteobacteria bacterium]
MSPRPKKIRHCGCKLKGRAFKPTGMPMGALEKIRMYRDEIEAMKLCDLDGLTQEEAGLRMGVSRGTVQRILSSARRKSAEALSGCKAIILDEVVCGKSEEK